MHGDSQQKLVTHYALPAKPYFTEVLEHAFVREL